ncbi:MAG TPA: hypothetical protein PLB97_01065 [Accumulibacter sp.]|nr:hypothetical protein [Accumulibacter sp.]HPP47583.1 hypothetical protein [Accumulibacter sp.]
MDRLQQWFEQFAGFSREERSRWEMALTIYCTPKLDISALHKPACWRRRALAKGQPR